MTEEAWMTFMPDGTDDDVWYTNPEGKLPEGYTYQKLNPNWSKEMAQPEQEPVKMVAYNCTCGKTMKFESEHGILPETSRPNSRRRTDDRHNI